MTDLQTLKENLSDALTHYAELIETEAACLKMRDFNGLQNTVAEKETAFQVIQSLNETVDTLALDEKQHLLNDCKSLLEKCFNSQRDNALRVRTEQVLIEDVFSNLQGGQYPSTYDASGKTQVTDNRMGQVVV